MKQAIKNAICKSTALLSERDAENLILLLECKIGIGSGSKPSSSGESVVFDALIALDNPELIIFDVGANKGQYANELVSKLDTETGINYLIHCFEPSQETFKALTKVHGSSNKIVLNNFGLADSVRESTLFMDSKGSGLASLTERKLQHFGINHGAIKETIKLQTLCNYVIDKGIEKINLVKIDVEGHELDVLSGGQNMFETGKVDLVQFEFGGCNIDTRTYFQDFYYYFDSIGYDLFRIVPSQKLLYLPKYREIDEKFRTANYLAANKSVNIRKKCGSKVI